MTSFLENIIRYNSFRIKVIIILGVFLLVTLLLLIRMNKKLIKYLVIVLVTSFIYMIPLIEISKKEIKMTDKYEKIVHKNIYDILPGIVCWGDSLTGGADSEFVPYPTNLKDTLEQKYTQKIGVDIAIPVINMGNGGEDSINIVGRSGRIPFTLNEFIIPSEISTVEISFEKIQGKDVKLGINGNFNGVNHCNIEGVMGDISGSQEQYYFTRLEAGKEVSVSKGTELITYGEQNWDYYSTCINIIFIGANGGYDDIDDLITQQHAIINGLDENNDKYLIISTTAKDRKEYWELEEAMSKEYGEKYLNLRDYLCSDAIYDAGLVPNEVELQQMEKGIVPERLRKDSIHYNEVSTPLVANHILNKLYQLGYFSELDEYVKANFN